MSILVTGAAGFIGYHVSSRLLADGQDVVGLDNFNDYYDPSLKKARAERLRSHSGFRLVEADMTSMEAVSNLFDMHGVDNVIHLAAQPGVRYSLENPQAYIDANIIGFFNILENAKRCAVKHFTYASSSSVYGLNTSMPFSVHDNVDHPISLYAATKKSNELIAHTYSHLYRLPCTGLRFFTVYGPWGRPDMALFLFTRAILENKPITVFNNGKMRRDFTYIDDIVEGIIRVLAQPAQPNPNWDASHPDPSTSPAPYRLYNIGNHNTVELGHFIEVIESCLGMKAQKNYLPIQPGDVEATYANVDALIENVGFSPSTPLEKGIQAFVDWYRDYYGV
ncbi:NAD-dependent epimerase [Desulfovibrio inopinatus]|uniref:NAD-dependent epimerase n=1 Tax=Desulfovibrio inopinatus TaxID=102109 RepID=UPI00041B5345|nr:NAD-dependent epimerase [Desulfovibrio inopinatus]